LIKFHSVGDKFMEHWRDDTEWLMPKHVEGNLLQHQSVHHKFHVTWPRIGPGPPSLRDQTLKTNRFSDGTRKINVLHDLFIMCM
jgi:hypothetical protein